MPDPTPPLPRPAPADRPSSDPHSSSLWRQSLEMHEDLEAGGMAGALSIGGWLVLFGIGRVVAVFAWSIALLADGRIFLLQNGWALFTTPGSKVYHPLWSTLIIYETAGNTLFLLFSLVLLGLFFARWKLFRPLMIVALILTVLFGWGDYLIAQQIPFFSARTNDPMLGSNLRSTVAAFIWVPYFLVSERVKKTFVK